VGSVTDGSEFGRILADAFDAEAARIGLGAGEGGGVDLDYYGGGPDRFFHAARGLPPRPIIGSDTLLEPSLLRGASISPTRLHVTSPFIAPSLLPPAGQRFLRAYRDRFGFAADPAAAYGYESMGLLLDAIRRAGSNGSDRGAVIDEVLSTRDRRSVLGTYSIDGDGDTTLDSVSGYRISDGLPVFPVKLTAPR
jgi:branched-chain amino acid transport system substrate-binding protein